MEIPVSNIRILTGIPYKVKASTVRPGGYTNPAVDPNLANQAGYPNQGAYSFQNQGRISVSLVSDHIKLDGYSKHYIKSLMDKDSTNYSYFTRIVCF